jgi:hypothetical protein
MHAYIIFTRLTLTPTVSPPLHGQQPLGLLSLPLPPTTPQQPPSQPKTRDMHIPHQILYVSSSCMSDRGGFVDSKKDGGEVSMRCRSEVKD